MSHEIPFFSVGITFWVIMSHEIPFFSVRINILGDNVPSDAHYGTIMVHFDPLAMREGKVIIMSPSTCLNPKKKNTERVTLLAHERQLAILKLVDR